MSKAYLQPFLIFPDAVLGSMLVTLAGETDATPVYDPNTGSILSQPLGINSVGEVTPFHANDNVLYDLHVFAAGVSAVVGNQLYSRENVTIVGGVNGAVGPAGPAGPTGPKGDKGDAGATGETGATGAAGTNGINGINGTNGADGIAGYIQLPALPVDPSTVPIGQPVVLPDGTFWTNVTGSWTTLAVSEAMLNAGLEGKQIVFTGICQHQYLTEADCEVDCTGAVPVFRIKTVRNGTPISAANPICFYTDGDGAATKHEIDTPVSVEFTYTSGLWGFYFDNTGTLIASHNFDPWNDLSRIAVVWRAYINTTRTGQARYETESVEYHRNNISWSAHEWMHTQGTIHLNGLDSVSNVLAHTAGVPTVAPNADGRNTCVSITSGATSDDGLRIDIINSTNALAWNQDLGNTSSVALTSANAAQMQMTYNDANGLLFMAPATRFPFAWNPVNNYPQYITSTGVFTDVPDNRWMVNFVYSLQDSRNGKQVRLRSATQAFTSFTAAQAYGWDALQAQSATIRDNEIRPLYKITSYVNYTAPNVYNAACKFAGIVEIADIRKSQVQNSVLASGTVPATNVSVAPIVGLVSTNGQGAFAELQSDKLDKVEAAAQYVTSPVYFSQGTYSTAQNVEALGAITTGTGTNNVMTAIEMRRAGLVSMADGYGVCISAKITDQDQVNNAAGRIAWARDGADNSTSAYITTYLAGSEVRTLDIRKDGTTAQLNNPAPTSNDISHATTQFVNESRSYGKDAAFPFKTATPTYLPVCDVTLPANGEFYVGFKIMLYDLSGSSPIVLEYCGASKQGVTGSAKLRALSGTGISVPISNSNFAVVELTDQGDGRIRIGLYALQDYTKPDCKARIFDKVFHPGLMVAWNPDEYSNSVPYTPRETTYPS